MGSGAGWRRLTGQDEAGLCAVPGHAPAVQLQAEVLPHWQVLAGLAAEAGCQLRIASGWRGFERQRAIWNAKAAGQRPVLGCDGQPLDLATMSEDALLFAILRWSAIPGCSRHHWGTDMDVYDAAAVPQDYIVQLTPAECAGCGPFAPLHGWLDECLASPDAVFFRPYAVDTGGIAPEQWHLSCRPAAEQLEVLLDETRLIDWLVKQDIALKENIRSHWHEIFHRYVRVAAQ